MRAARVDVEEKVADAAVTGIAAADRPADDQDAGSMGAWISQFVPQVGFHISLSHFPLSGTHPFCFTRAPPQKVAQIYGLAMIGCCISVSLSCKTFSSLKLATHQLCLAAHIGVFRRALLGSSLE